MQIILTAEKTDHALFVILSTTTTRDEINSIGVNWPGIYCTTEKFIT